MSPIERELAEVGRALDDARRFVGYERDPLFIWLRNRRAELEAELQREVQR